MVLSSHEQVNNMTHRMISWRPTSVCLNGNRCGIPILQSFVLVCWEGSFSMVFIYVDFVSEKVGLGTLIFLKFGPMAFWWERTSLGPFYPLKRFLLKNQGTQPI